MSEFKNLTPPVKIPVNLDRSSRKMSDSLQLTNEEWEELEKQHKETLNHFAEPFINSFMQKEEEVPFTLPEVMSYLQDNLSQQNIMMLATQQIMSLLQNALEKTKKHPLYELLEVMGEMQKAKEATEEVNEDTSVQDQNDI